MMTDATPKSIAVIGAGVMGEALISALIQSGISASSITICEKREDRAKELVTKYQIVQGTLIQAVTSAEALLLVVKPQDMAGVLADIKSLLPPKALVLSFVAGKRIEFIASGLGSANPVIRVMPNTPTLVGAGMAAISLGTGVKQEHANFVRGFLESTGRVVEVAEELQDAVTALSGSGPAYFFAFVESMISAGIDLGLPADISSELAIQTMIGSAKLLAESGKSPTTLRENVTSPNGTTAAALATFGSENLSEIVKKAMTSARNRSQELA